MLSALHTVYEMLRDRNYTINPGYEWMDDTKKVIARVKQDELVIKAEHISSTSTDKLVVFFAAEPKVKVARVRLYKDRMAKEKVNHMILVYAKQVTPKAKEELNSLDVEYFTALELYRNIYYHHLVPKHEKMNVNEVQKLLIDKDIESTDKLPKIRVSDWPVRYFNWKPGSVIRIHRMLGAQQEPHYYYRVVTSTYITK